MKGVALLGIIALTSGGCTHSTEPPLAVPFTATAMLADVNSLAQSHKDGLLLMSVGSKNVSFEGKSSTWQYAYFFPDTAVPPKLYWFHASSGGAAFDSTSLIGVGSVVITHSWSDSDSALLIAEQNGGSQFRTNNPSYVISASVGEPDVPNPTTYWDISYYSSNDNTKFLLFRIDANTGAAKTYRPD